MDGVAELRLFGNRCQLLALAARDVSVAAEFDELSEMDWDKVILLEEAVRYFTAVDLPRIQAAYFNAKQERTEQ